MIIIKNLLRLDGQYSIQKCSGAWVILLHLSGWELKFLDKNTSTYKDFSTWGINIYMTQDHLNEYELSNKLSFEQIENNRKKIMEKFNEETINESWNEFLY